MDNQSCIPNPPISAHEDIELPMGANMNIPQTSGRPARAYIHGGPLAPTVNGMVNFRDVPGGVMVCAQISGLPTYRPAPPDGNPIGPHGFHIHERGDCTPGTAANPFPGTGEHWNPTNQPHGNHPGDFPVLFSNNGSANMCFFTNKFRVSDVIERSVVIHQCPDDYRTQPAGNSGPKVACGVIRENY